MTQDYIVKITTIVAEVPYLKSIVASLLAVLFIYVIKSILVHSIKSKKSLNNDSVLLVRKINVYTRYVVVLTVFLLWFSQLQGVFVSLLAVAAAVVLAFKEMIMCVTGGILLKSANLFKLGDRIEIGSTRGFVIERNLLSTKILEIGPEKNSQQTTGNIVSFPNSLVFSNVLKNESYFKGYSIKSYIFALEERKNLVTLEEFLLKESNQICASYLDQAKRSISQFCAREAIAIPSIEPRTKILIEDDNKMKVLLKMPVRNNEIGDVEQKLNRSFVRYLDQYEDRYKEES
jgi:small-conductance mechanosensitive channel